MKTIFTTLVFSLVLMFSFSAQATTHTVTVQDFSFSPSTLEVNVGDVIMWTWVSGSHTTSPTTIPGGAVNWGTVAINSSSTTFSYTVTVAGTYNYECTIHPTLMMGSFTATVTGISPVVSSTSLLLNSTLVSNDLQISYKLDKSSAVDVLLLDMSGKQVEKLNSANHSPGTYTETYSLGSLSKGEYVLELRANDIIASRKIVIE